MKSTYNYKLKLTPKQEQLVRSWIGTCRFVYNLALEERICAYQSTGKSVHKFELMKQLVDLKDVEWIKSVPCQTLQNVIERLDSAFCSMFRGGGFPHWAKKHKYNSILFKGVKLENGWFILPKLGKVKIFKDRMPDGELNTAIITKENDNFYLHVTFERKPIHLLPNENQVGVDVGLVHFLVDSDGHYESNPKHFKRFEEKLRIEQRSLSRKKKYSNSWKRQAKKVGELMGRIARVRADFLHKLSRKYIDKYGFIFSEDLPIENMVRNKHLAKHILDCGWGMFFDMLKYKAELYGRVYEKVNPKYTSQRCSVCGYVHKDNRPNQETFICLECGFEANADFNAALNIMSQGMASVRERETIVCA